MSHTQGRTKAAIALAVAGIIILMIGCIKSRRTLKIRSLRTEAVATGAAEKQPPLSASERGAGMAPKEKIKLEEFKIMQSMVDLMKTQVEESSSRNLIRDLQALGLGPDPTFTTSESTGRITVIRTTENPDPNTRHLWAQFRSRADGSQEYLHMMYFEFRPGTTAMDEAQEMVKKVFSLNRPADFRSAIAVAWDINERYEVLINTINEEHLKQEVFDRKFTSEDLGVVQITVQVKDGEHAD